MIIDINQVVVPNKFEKYPPKEEKLELVRRYFNNYGVIDKPITTVQFHGNYKIIDGYTRYLIAKEKGLTEIESTVLAKTKYFVYASHPGNSKLYCWRLPNSVVYEEFMKEVQRGDEILVHTSKGKKVVIFDSITTDEPDIVVSQKLASSKIVNKAN